MCWCLGSVAASDRCPPRALARVQQLLRIKRDRQIFSAFWEALAYITALCFRGPEPGPRVGVRGMQGPLTGRDVWSGLVWSGPVI